MAGFPLWGRLPLRAVTCFDVPARRMVCRTAGGCVGQPEVVSDGRTGRPGFVGLTPELTSLCELCALARELLCLSKSALHERKPVSRKGATLAKGRIESDWCRRRT